MLTTTVLVEVNSDTCALVCVATELVTVSAFWAPGSGELNCWDGGGGKLGGAVEFTPPEGAVPWNWSGGTYCGGACPPPICGIAQNTKKCLMHLLYCIESETSATLLGV